MALVRGHLKTEIVVDPFTKSTKMKLTTKFKDGSLPLVKSFLEMFSPKRKSLLILLY